MLFYMMIIFVIAMVPAGIMFGVLLLVEYQKSKRMRSFLERLRQSGRISEDEFYSALNGKNVSQQMYYQATEQSPVTAQSPMTAQPQGMYPQVYQPSRVQAFAGQQDHQQQVPRYPQYTATQTMQGGKKTSSASLLLLIGVFLVILSGIIFATTSWDQLGSPVKVILLLLSSGLFFGGSVLAHKKFGLKQTGAAFYSLGSVFLPVAVLAIGFLELFGSWLSIYGRGAWLLGVIASVPLGAAFFIGHRTYKKPVLYWLFFFSVAVCISSTALFISDTLHMMALGMTAYSVALIILSRCCKSLYCLKPQTEVFLWIATGLGLISGTTSLFRRSMGEYTDIVAIIVVGLICMLLIFKGAVDREDIAKHLSPVFLLLLLIQCFININVLIDKSTSLYFSVAVTALGVLFEFVRGKDKTPLLRTPCSDIAFTVAVFLSVFLVGTERIEASLIWLCLFIMMSLFGQRQRAMRFLRPVSIFFFAYMLVGHFVGFNYYWPVLVGAALLFVFTALPILSGKGQYSTDSRLCFGIASGIATAALEMFFIFDLWAPRNIPLLVGTVFLLIAGIAVAYYNKKLFTILFPMLFSIPFLSISFASLFEIDAIAYEAQLQGIFAVALFLLFMLAGRLLHKKVFEDGLPDVFTFSAFIAPFYLFLIDEAWWNLAGWLMLGVYGFSFWGRIGKEKTERTLALLGSIAVCAAIYTQSIFNWNDVIHLKVFLILPFLVLLLCRFWLFPSLRNTLGTIAFGYTIFATVVLFGEAIFSERIFDALLLGIFGIAVIAISFMKKNKRWFFFSCITTIAVALYLSRSFWMSLTWWAYLLIGGGILIAIAVISEANRHRGKSLKGNALSFFDDWS